MNDTPTRPPLAQLDTTANRHAATLAEIQQMTADYHSLQSQVTELQRTVDRLTNRVELGDAALVEAHNAERVYRNKLIRLASAMENITRLSAEAEAIMKDAREMDEAATSRIVAGHEG